MRGWGRSAFQEVSGSASGTPERIGINLINKSIFLTEIKIIQALRYVEFDLHHSGVANG